jgi:hypothetical protein
MRKALKKLNPFKEEIPVATAAAPRNNNQRNKGPDVDGGSLKDAAVVTPAGNIDNFGKKDCYGIKALYNSASAVVDIIFVRGLMGSSYTTWLHEKSGVHWPRDLLKNDIQNARIMTFGYDVDVVNFWKHAAQDGISGYANDLLGSLAGCREDISVRSSSLCNSFQLRQKFLTST